MLIWYAEPLSQEICYTRGKGLRYIILHHDFVYNEGVVNCKTKVDENLKIIEIHPIVCKINAIYPNNQ